MIQCSDNSSYLGDILIGADGAYSAVRQSLYRQLNEKKELPFKDTQGLKIGYMTMVGTTEPLEEDAYEELKDDFTRFNFVIGKGKPYTVSFFFLRFCVFLLFCFAGLLVCLSVRLSVCLIVCFVCVVLQMCLNNIIDVATEDVNKRIKASLTYPSIPSFLLLSLSLSTPNSGAHLQSQARESAGVFKCSSLLPRPMTWPSGTPNGVLNPTRT